MGERSLYGLPSPNAYPLTRLRRIERLGYKGNLGDSTATGGKQMKRSLTAMLGVLLIAGMTFIVTNGPSEAQAQSQKKKAARAAHTASTQPHFDEAYRLLRRSHYVLNHSCHKLGGHRAEAIKQIELALGEVQAGITLNHGTMPTVEESGDIHATQGQVHPYIHDALRQCKEAKAQLQSAQASGGHRDKAIQYIDAAIVHLQAAVQEPACT